MIIRMLVVLISIALYAGISGVSSVTLAKDGNWIHSTDKSNDAEIESLSVDDEHTSQDPSSGSAQGNNNNQKSIAEINEENIKRIPVKIIDGDIAVDPDAPKSDFDKRSSNNDLHYLWLDRVIPYKFDRNLSKATKRAIEEAIAHFEGKTCLTFTSDIANKKNWLLFGNYDGCYSSLGRQFFRRGGQRVSIGVGCGQRGIILHEIMHAIGFYHEQSRYDRDKYIKVLWENIEPRKEDNFKKEPNHYSQLLGTKYDYMSLMQYEKTSFSKNGRDTLEALEEPRRQLGQRIDFTDNDLAEINELYQCKKSTGGFTKWSSWGPCVEGENGGYTKTRQRYCYEKDLSKCTKPVNGVVSRYGIITEWKALTCADCKLDGHWGRWSSWSLGGRKCGFEARTRKCNDPAPRCKGAACSGNSTEKGKFKFPCGCPASVAVETAAYNVQCTGRKNTQKNFIENSRCTFSCKRGFVYQSGDPERNCGPFDEWSGVPIKCDDKEPPKLLSCPSNIDKNSSRAIRVTWEEPQYSDNSGSSSGLKITSNYLSGSTFPIGRTKVVYVAVDPTGNKNRECSFIVSVKEPVCPSLKAPKNGMLATRMMGDKQAFPSCQAGFYPTAPFPFYYICGNNGLTSSPHSLGRITVPDCIQRKPPSGLHIGMFNTYQKYTGDCNTVAAQAQIKLKLPWVDGLKFVCGEKTTV